MRRGTPLPLTVRALRRVGGVALAALFAESLGFGGDAARRVLQRLGLQRHHRRRRGAVPAARGARPPRAARLGVPRPRAAASWSAGEIHWTLEPADSAYSTAPGAERLARAGFYPASYVAIVLMVRARLRERQRAAVARRLRRRARRRLPSPPSSCFEPLIGASAEPGSLLLTDVAYPVGDLLLLAVVTGVFGLTGWRPGRSWAVHRRGLVAARDRRRPVPLPGDARLLRRRRAARRAVARLDAAARLGRLGARRRAPGARHRAACAR